jgi:hypothetical protein
MTTTYGPSPGSIEVARLDRAHPNRFSVVDVDSGDRVRGHGERPRNACPPDEPLHHGELNMPHYLLSVCHDDDYGDIDFDDPETARSVEQVSSLNDTMKDEGAWVFGGGLLSASSATVVRATAGGVSMTDGPFAETEEQMGGFWVIEAADFDSALDWAGQATVACDRPIEVRPFDGLS